MARPVRRNKNVVDYSQFGDLEDDDEDFACVAAPSSKKSRTQRKDSKKEKKEKQKKPNKELTPSQKQTPSKRISLDEKLYQRGLEVALALSIKEKPANVPEVQNSEEQGLNHVRYDDIPRGDCRQRTAASKVPVYQTLLTADSNDRECATDSKLESEPSEESEEDSDYSEGNDEDFAMEEIKAKENKKKTREKIPAEREKKTPKSKIDTTVVSPSWVTKQKSEPPQKMSSSLEPVGRPLHTSSPVTDKKPKWIPPAFFSHLESCLIV